MPFETALQFLKQGYCVSRELWGEGKYLYLSRDGDIYMMNDGFTIWCNTQGDLMAEDWYTVV